MLVFYNVALLKYTRVFSVTEKMVWFMMATWLFQKCPLGGSVASYNVNGCILDGLERVISASGKANRKCIALTYHK